MPLLVELMAEPTPKVIDGSTPPPTYWEARTKMWNDSEGWIRWALKEITGESFQTAREWAAWLEMHKKEYAK